jgi:dolichol kinase
MSEYGWALILAGCLLIVFGVSNYAYIRGVPFYISRKIAHLGSAPLMVALPLVFESIVFPLGLAGAFFMMLVANRRTNVFPGFAKKERLSELFFPLSVFVAIAALWSIDPWAAIVPGLWLAVGDGVTGLVRMKVNKREVKGWWGSLACLGVCLPLGLLVTPIWAGMLGGAVATLAERYCGDAAGAVFRLDDNLAMPLAGMLVMVPLLIW